MTPVLCDGVKKDPRPSLGDNVDERGCWLFDDDEGRVEDEEGEGEFMMREYIFFSKSKSALSAIWSVGQERTCQLGRRYQRSPA